MTKTNKISLLTTGFLSIALIVVSSSATLAEHYDLLWRTDTGEYWEIYIEDPNCGNHGTSCVWLGEWCGANLYSREIVGRTMANNLYNGHTVRIYNRKENYYDSDGSPVCIIRP